VTADMLAEFQVELTELRAEFARLRQRVEELEQFVKG
jgi:ubiquinone biosynthesis protein UbiJ